MFKMTEQNPHTVRLPVHLPEQQAYFFDGKEDKETFKNKNVGTKLTSYFELSKSDPIAKNSFYYEMPLNFTWNNSQRKWTRRIK